MTESEDRVHAHNAMMELFLIRYRKWQIVFAQEQSRTEYSRKHNQEIMNGIFMTLRMADYILE